VRRQCRRVAARCPAETRHLAASRLRPVREVAIIAACPSACSPFTGSFSAVHGRQMRQQPSFNRPFVGQRNGARFGQQVPICANVGMRLWAAVNSSYVSAIRVRTSSRAHHQQKEHSPPPLSAGIVPGGVGEARGEGARWRVVSKAVRLRVLFPSCGMSKTKLRVYVTHRQRLWRMYSVWFQNGSFYYTFAPGQHGHDAKFTYHPEEFRKWGHVHTKQNDRGTIVQRRGTKSAKTGWPDFRNLGIAPIDSYGFQTIAFEKDDAFLRGLRKTDVESPAIVFEIDEVIPAFMLRLFLGKTDAMDDREALSETAFCSPETLIALEQYRFGRIETSVGIFDFSIAVALVRLEAL
jgi:hypothetical protein